MNSAKISAGNISIVTGLFIFIAMVLYFIIMNLANFAHIPELRFLNIFIAAIGVVCAIKYYLSQSEKHIKYLQGLSLGFTSVIIGSSLFALFIFCYFQFIDPELLNTIRIDAPVTGINITPLTAAISVITEGVISGLVLSFIAMQYFKDDSLHAPAKSVSAHFSTDKD